MEEAWKLTERQRKEGWRYVNEGRKEGRKRYEREEGEIFERQKARNRRGEERDILRRRQWWGNVYTEKTIRKVWKDLWEGYRQKQDKENFHTGASAFCGLCLFASVKGHLNATVHSGILVPPSSWWQLGYILCVHTARQEIASPVKCWENCTDLRHKPTQHLCDENSSDIWYRSHLRLLISLTGDLKRGENLLKEVVPHY